MTPTVMVEVPENPDKDKELSVGGPGGVSLRAKGYRLVDLLFVIVGGGVIWGALELRAHAADSGNQSAAIVKSINEASDKMVKALERVADEQKATNAELRQVKNAQRETNCLQDPAMRNRPDAREVCKRLSGGDR